MPGPRHRHRQHKCPEPGQNPRGHLVGCQQSKASLMAACARPVGAKVRLG